MNFVQENHRMKILHSTWVQDALPELVVTPVRYCEECFPAGVLECFGMFWNVLDVTILYNDWNILE